jgi:Ca2+-dependent lipid-binding protein
MAANTVAVLINVIEARDLKPRSSSGMCDPVLIVETLGEQLHTPTVKKDLSPYWNHYFHIEEKCKNFQRETLDVTVYDTATTFRKELIGSFEFELSDIYAQKNHEYFNVWVILSNHTLPGKPGVQGYLKLSVTVLKPGDTPVQHTEEGVEDSDVQEDNLANMVLLKPAGLDAVEHTLKTKVFKAENLPKMDTLGVCDPFVEIKYANNTNRSRVEKNTAAPVWNEEVNLPVTMPSMAGIYKWLIPYVNHNPLLEQS